MKLIKCKTYTAIAILTFAMAISLVALPATAQPGVTLASFPILDVVPNPVGVGENALIRFGVMQQLPSVY
ncbi:MAG: hypothetical protein QW744_07015, partial [Candidatus Bathyarchaeia archaeon]